MPRSVLDRWREDWRGQALEQIAHAAAGDVASTAVGLVAALWLGSGWSGALGVLAALLAGLVRELVQNWGDDDWRETLDDAGVDLAAWVLGGVWGAVPVWVLA